MARRWLELGTTTCLEFFRIIIILGTDMSPVKQAKQEWENPLGRESLLPNSSIHVLSPVKEDEG